MKRMADGGWQTAKPNAIRRLPSAIWFLTPLVALLALIYFRPLTLFFAARRVYLALIGMKSEFVQVGSHRIHYWVGGEGPPLVLVHGVAMRAEDWAPLLRTLAKTHRVYAPDLLGYGDSDQPRGSDYSVATQSDIVRGFIDAMHLQQPDVAGISMGGWIAMKFASEHPERVKRLVLLSSAGLAYESTLTESSFSATTIAEQRASFALQSDLAPRLPDFILRDVIRHSKTKAWIVRASMRSMLTRADLPLDGKLQRVHMPVLIVAGTKDRIVPFDVAKRLHRELPQSQLVPLTGCGHLGAFECRRETIRAVTAFLR
ncbi:MAG: alpha/beta hydrolase [Acidobacteria bacterium]|nr:MAG: alpha/beta hydrolase [Acidobacteriota bacterium]